MVCEYVDINPRVEKKPQVKKICGPIEQTLLQGTHCLGLVSSWRTTVHKCSCLLEDNENGAGEGTTDDGLGTVSGDEGSRKDKGQYE